MSRIIEIDSFIMKIKKYRPAFFSGFEDEYYEINSKEELLASDLCKASIRLEYDIALSYDPHQSAIMAVKKDASEWWVLALIQNKQDIELLREWLPDVELKKKDI